jgi:nonsense-mediated mRNA decay protein 3
MARFKVNIGYYEGILQLRNPNKEIIHFVREFCREEGVKLALEEKVANGVDFYLSSQKKLQTLGRRLHGKFHGELNTTRKLMTQDKMTNKKIYRLNLLFRMPQFKKGDMVMYKGRCIQVKAIWNKKFLGIDMDSGEKINLKYNEI